MNDDPCSESFVLELRREFSPAQPSPKLARAVAAAFTESSLNPASASWPTAFFQSRAWLSWAGFATVAAAALTMLIGVWTSGQKRAAAGATMSAEARSFLPSAPRAALLLPPPAVHVSTDETGNVTPQLYRPVLVRDRREYVDTLRWRDRRTGARIEVSYPRAEFDLVAAEPM